MSDGQTDWRTNVRGEDDIPADIQVRLCTILSTDWLHETNQGCSS